MSRDKGQTQVIYIILDKKEGKKQGKTHSARDLYIHTWEYQEPKHIYTAAEYEQFPNLRYVRTCSCISLSIYPGERKGNQTKPEESGGRDELACAHGRWHIMKKLPLQRISRRGRRGRRRGAAAARPPAGPRRGGCGGPGTGPGAAGFAAAPRPTAGAPRRAPPPPCTPPAAPPRSPPGSSPDE